MTIGVLKEQSPETRVSLLPEHVVILKKWNINVCIESNAGAAAFATDEKYTEARATVKSRTEILNECDIILSINAPEQSETDNLKSKILPYFCRPFTISRDGALVDVLEKLFCKRKKLKQCQVKKEPINPISVAENRCMVSVNVWKLLTDVKY